MQGKCVGKYSIKNTGPFDIANKVILLLCIIISRLIFHWFFHDHLVKEVFF